MDDQYYYLLDGKEQGPFSRAAIDSLAANGALASALLRTGSDPTWRTAEELGLSSVKASEPPKPKPAVDKYGFPIGEISVAASFPATDPSTATSRLNNPASVSAASIMGIGAAVIALVAGGAWFLLTKNNHTSVAVSAKGRPLSDLKVGDWSIQTGTLSKEPETARLARIRNGGLLLDPDTTSQQGSRMYLVDSMGMELRHRTGFRLYESTIEGDNCLLATFKYETKNQFGSITSTQKQGPCIATEDRVFSNFGGPAVAISRGEMYWIAVSEAMAPLRFKVLTITEHAKSSPRQSKNEAGNQVARTEIEVSQCEGEAPQCQKGSPTPKPPLPPRTNAELSGTYTCEAKAPPDHLSCSFFASKDAVASIVGPQIAEDVQLVSFTNPDELTYDLALDEAAIPSGCLVSGQASIKISSHKLLDGEGGYYIEAKLESVTSKEGPKALVGSDQLESCQSI